MRERYAPMATSANKQRALLVILGTVGFGLAKDCDVTIIGKGVRHSDFKQKWAGGNGHSIEVSGRTNTKVRG